MKSLKQIKQSIKNAPKGLSSLKVALLGDTATQFLSLAIRGLAIDHGYRLDFFEADYNQVERLIEDPSSELYQFNPKYIIIFQSTHKWAELHSKRSSSKQITLAEERLRFVRETCIKNSNSKIIYCNYPEIGDSIFGSYANKVESSFNFQVRKMNYELMILSQNLPNLFICDLAEWQNKIGRDQAFIGSIYSTTEIILSLDHTPSVAQRLIDIIMAAEGHVKKCVILDLDNTLWGGVIGDDGLEGIQIGHGLGIGKIFSEFQHWLKKLKERGLILCVCSKNTESIAKEPFEKHPDMVLRLEDITIFMANWKTKVENIHTIQKTLNIGFDSMVFLDDNPFERNMVREHIPGITVPDLPEDPSEYLEYLYGLNLFEIATYSEEDHSRTKQYQIEAERLLYSNKFENEADYLNSLNMTSEVLEFNKFNTPRIAQLSQRSNQFNLRTIRYTESDITNIINDRNNQGFSFSLKDKFGDHGLIGVVLLNRIDKDTLFVDSWFMSCRVLNRTMENFTLNQIINWAKQRGFKTLIGEYIPTAKNQLVKNHYLNLGFKEAPERGASFFVQDVTQYIYKETYIRKYEKR